MSSLSLWERMALYPKRLGLEQGIEMARQRDGQSKDITFFVKAYSTSTFLNFPFLSLWFNGFSGAIWSPSGCPRSFLCFVHFLGSCSPVHAVGIVHT
jgi:hypothetical protein